MKKQVKLLVMAITMCMLLSGMPVHASSEDSEGEESSLWYVNISDASAYLSISNGTATCETILSCKISKSLSITMKLQKYSGGSWVNVSTWTASDSSGTVLTLKKSKSISSGTYRVQAIFKCGTESVTKNSSSKTY